MIELALGTLLFVTVLMLGVYLSETSYLSLKVNEAANFAVWYSTGLRVHHFNPASAASPGNIYRPWGTVIADANDQAQARYADFDGRTGTSGSGTRQAFSQATPVQVNCAPDRRVKFAIPRTPGPAPDPVPSGGDYYADVDNLVQRYFDGNIGGMRCTASTRVATLTVPNTFLERGSGGFFHRANWAEAPILLCGAGRARAGQCRGEYGVLLGDWSVEGPPGDRANSNVLFQRAGNDNAPYRNMVEALYETNGRSRGRAASKFAAALGKGSNNPAQSPYNESDFYTSYAGVENGYIDATTQGIEVRDTTGEDQTTSYITRGNCFLGRSDCGQ